MPQQPCDGLPVGPAEITRVVSAKAFDRKHLVSFAVPKPIAHEARHVAPRPPAGVRRCEPFDEADTDPLICRCEDVRRSTLAGLIDQGYHSFDELKRITRVGMGPCQGRTCQRLILQMLSKTLNEPAANFAPMTARSPLKPVRFDTLAQVELDDGA